MSRSPTSTFALLGALLVVTPAQAISRDEPQIGSSGPNMPPLRDVVPSEIRSQEPAVTGSMRAPTEPGPHSRWHDLKRPPVRPPIRPPGL